ncbi:MAG TPA: tRNA lysidine(34) synthetase TilS [Sphingomonas sp.]|jgi:tRNA(Ile)-lysidine synthase|uniref:tRNA lysidine(34) synthetase TilS n=1 Tax=Sphingomonas sp. TaxID=28214 RepID=UPI002EDA0139
MPDAITALRDHLAGHPALTPFAVAVSGGPDSLALLLLAQAVRPGDVHAATVDHGLRPDSAAEAATVARLCADRGIPHHTLRATWSPAPGIGLQAQARAYRYGLLDTWCREQAIPLLLTAHHRDDQAETLLMRLARGAGLSGLAGVRERRPLQAESPVTLARPLLDVAKADLAAFVAGQGLTPVDDPANHDPRHDRTWTRTFLGRTPALDPARLAASARHLAEAETALEWTTAKESEARIHHIDAETLFLDPTGLPEELLRRLVLRCLHARDITANPSGPSLKRLIERLKSGNAATLGATVARVEPCGWMFRPAPPRRPTRNTH